MKVSEIMTRTLLTIDGNASVTEAAKKMKEFDVGFLVVVSDYAVLGLLTDRDIVTRALAEDRDIKSCLVKDVASTNPVTCKATSDLYDAVRLFSEHQIHRILVIDENDSPVGVLSLGDLAAKAKNEQLIALALKQVKKELLFKELSGVAHEPTPTEIRSPR